MMKTEAVLGFLWIKTVAENTNIIFRSSLISFFLSLESKPGWTFYDALTQIKTSLRNCAQLKNKMCSVLKRPEDRRNESEGSRFILKFCMTARLTV